MRQNAVSRLMLIILGVSVAAGAVASQHLPDGLQDEPDAQTSFDEPGDRPQNPELEIDLPEPFIPPEQPDTPGSEREPGTEPEIEREPDDGARTDDAALGVVNGTVVGSLAAPALPDPPATAEAPTASVPASLLDRFDRGTAVAGAALGTEGRVLSPPRAPSIDADPRSVDEADATATPEGAARELDVAGRWPEEARASGGVVADAQVIAYYGHPFSRYMGILGESAIDVMAEQLKARAAEYDAINGEIGVAPAFHIIYGTVYEDASIGILREHKLLEYIEYARENDLIVFLDHQIGDGTVEGAIREMLPYLGYDNVHLAIDPEWATDAPGKEIGGITADELNMAQQLIQDYLEKHELPGPRMLVVHQFNWRMIEERERVRSDYPQVQLIHNADGFGQPAHKRDSWRFNVLADNMPLKGFKLFYPKSWRDGGYDDPLMSPHEVMQLEPVPVYIQYQ
jgi:hypothetical protein